MNNLTKIIKKNNSYRKVFRKAKKAYPKTVTRLAIESLLLLITGITTYLLLQTISKNNDIISLLNSTATTYYEAILSLGIAIKSTISIILVFLLACFCIIIFLSSFWRLVKLISIISSSKFKQKKY